MQKGMTGVILALLAGLWIGTVVGRGGESAHAQTVDDKTTRWLAASVSVGQDVDALALFDSQTQRLVFYRFDGDTLRLLSVRDVTYDLKPREYPERKQMPPVLKMQELYEKYMEDQKGRPSADDKK